MDVRNTFSVASRFCGPPGSANGGYFAGCVASFAGDIVRVRLMQPPPLDTPLHTRWEDGVLVVLHDGEAVAQAVEGELDLDVPPPPSYEEALAASRHYAGFKAHAWPECFVCGPNRTRGDGMRVFAGPLRPGQVAAPWVPDASLKGSDGKVAPEFMWAALDCPGFFAACDGDRKMLLGEFTAHVDRCVHIDEPCTIVAWQIAESGRKHTVGTALHDEDGELCAKARGVWIAPREG
jgi:hypothetical protein